MNIQLTEYASRLDGDSDASRLVVSADGIEILSANLSPDTTVEEIENLLDRFADIINDRTGMAVVVSLSHR